MKWDGMGWDAASLRAQIARFSSYLGDAIPRMPGEEEEEAAEEAVAQVGFYLRSNGFT